MPQWVKFSLIALAVLAAVFVISRIAGVEHGPGLHRPGGGTPVEQSPGGHTPPIQHSP